MCKKTRSIYVLCVVVGLCLLGCRHNSNLDTAFVSKQKTEQMKFQRMLDATVNLLFIVSKQGSTSLQDAAPVMATGVIIDSHTVLTAAHFTRMWSELGSSDTLEVTPILIESKGCNKMQLGYITLESEERDLALIHVVEPFPVVYPEIAQTTPTLGSIVYTVGLNAIDSGLDLRLGIVARDDGDGEVEGVSLKDTFLINVAVVPGNSGGPVYDTDGRLVGIVQTSYGSLDTARSGSFPFNIGGAARAESINTFLATRDPQITLSDVNIQPEEPENLWILQNQNAITGFLLVRFSKTNSKLFAIYQDTF